MIVGLSLLGLHNVPDFSKFDGPDADKSEWIKLEFLIDPDNQAFKYPQQFAI
jgi:hypothetical protein